MEHFLLTIVCVVKDQLCTSSILFNSFKEALYYAQKDAEYYKHLANEYKEEIGIYQHVGYIDLKGKSIRKRYDIFKMVEDTIAPGQRRYTTKGVVDFLPNDRML